jgi:hypothetical protein
MPVVEPYFDRSLGIVVKTERQRLAAMKVKGLIDAREWNSVESVEREATKNLKSRLSKRDEYLQPAIARAVHKMMHGYDEEAVMRELEYRLTSTAPKVEPDGT